MPEWDPGGRSAIALLTGLMVLLITGCTVGPDYRKPAVEMPGQWSEIQQAAYSESTTDLSRWWMAFSDPELNSLVEKAMHSSKDLAAAEARVRESRALLGVVSSSAFPSVNASGAYTRKKGSSKSGGAASPGTSSGGQDLFQVGFDSSWELDIFGGTRRAVEAARATMESAEDEWRSTLVTLISEVARNYLELRGNQLRASIARQTIELQRQTLELSTARFEAGLATDLDVSQAAAQLATTEALVPALETLVHQGAYLIGVLLGVTPESMLDELISDAPLPPPPPGVPVGLPSDLLRRRPDVRSAERQLAAATAQIGVAVADLFPKFSLTGSLGQQSVSLSDLASPGSRFWSIGPGIVWPVFDAGRTRANIRVQNARQEQALAAYEQAVLVSLKDVESALVAFGKEQATREALGRAVNANARAFEIANELYSRGLVDFQRVIDSQRTLATSRDLLAQSDQRMSLNLVALYKALGGGWDVPTDQ